MTRFIRGAQLDPIAVNEKYASGAATGFPTKISPSPITQDGFRQEECPAEYLNWLAHGAAGTFQASADNFLTDLITYPTGLVPRTTSIAARTSAGETLVENVAVFAPNVAHFYVDDPNSAAQTVALVPAGGQVNGVYSALAWENFILLVVSNSANANNALWRSTTTRSIGLTEGPALTGAVAGDFGTIGAVCLQRDQDERSIYLYSATNDKCWRSTNDGASFTALANPGRVRAWTATGGASQTYFTAAKGYAVLADCASNTQVTLRVFTAALGTWANVNIFAQTGNNRAPKALGFSDTLGRWVYLGQNGTVAISANTDPASAWTVVTADPAGTFGSVVSGFVLDSLVGLVFQNANINVVALTADLGQTWKAFTLLGGTAKHAYWDGAALWFGGMRTKAVAKLPEIAAARLSDFN